jgi:hypothetical protein
MTITRAYWLRRAVLLALAVAVFSGDAYAQPGRADKSKSAPAHSENPRGCGTPGGLPGPDLHVYRPGHDPSELDAARWGAGFLPLRQGLGGEPTSQWRPQPGLHCQLLRFVLSKEDGRKLIDRLSADKFHEVRIRFTIDRERELVGPGWRYLARISSVQV